MSARQILEPLGFEVKQIKMDVPELQKDKIEDVAKYSAKWASDELKCAVLKNDSGLCIDALNGFPDFSFAIVPFVIDLNITGSFPYSQYAKTSSKCAFLFSTPSKSFNTPSSFNVSST